MRHRRNKIILHVIQFLQIPRHGMERTRKKTQLIFASIRFTQIEIVFFLTDTTRCLGQHLDRTACLAVPDKSVTVQNVLDLRALPQIVPAFFHPRLSRSTNLVENFFRFIDRRITPMDRFQGEDTAQAVVKLILLWYRLHKFTNPSKRYWDIKGKSPLQLAGVKTGKLNWLKVGLGT